MRDTFLREWVLVHGPPARGISDCGSEFMSRAFLEATDLIQMFKECTPAYASDRHASVERLIRTIREACERSLRHMLGPSTNDRSAPGQTVTVRDLDMLVLTMPKYCI